MPRTNRTIPFISGLDVRPSSVSAIGIVNFETEIAEGDVTVFVEIEPNQLQCEAYGYTYNKATGTCSIFRHNIDVATTFDNINNNTQGPRNNVANGVENTYVMGQENTLQSLTKNNIVIGSNNTIKSYVENSSIQGTLGEATATNSIVLGGNASNDILGERQSIQVLYGYQSVNGSNKSSYLNNTTDSLFAIPDNTVMYFHADVVAVRVGGTHATGAVGDFASWVERGVIINKSGVLSISRERDTIKSSGTVTNWQPTGIVDGIGFAMRVRGHADSNIRFTQIKTGVTL